MYIRKKGLSTVGDILTVYNLLTSSSTICLHSSVLRYSEFKIALAIKVVCLISSELIQTRPFMPTAVSKGKYFPNKVKIGVLGFNNLFIYVKA